MIVLESLPYKPKVWLRYVMTPSTFSLTIEKLSSCPYIIIIVNTMTLEIESDNSLPFIHVLVTPLPLGRLRYSVYREPSYR